jgi:hypothetical protein
MCIVIGLGFLGFMPLGILSPELAVGDWWLVGSFPRRFPWWRLLFGGGSDRIPFNKATFVPNRGRISLLLEFSSCCRGGRRREMEEMGSSSLHPVGMKLFFFLLRRGSSGLKEGRSISFLFRPSPAFVIGLRSRRAWGFPSRYASTDNRILLQRVVLAAHKAIDATVLFLVWFGKPVIFSCSGDSEV